MDNLRVLTRVAGGYAFVGGLITLIGWAANIPRLTDWANLGMSMLPNMAAAVTVAGAALVLRSYGHGRIAAGLALFTGAVGAATLFEHVSGIDLGIDSLILARPWGQQGTYVPGRLGPPGALSLAILGAGMALASLGHRSRQAASAGGTVVMGITLLSIVGYIFGAGLFYSVPRFTTIALPTATILLALGIGLVMSLPDAQPMRILRENSSAGVLVRRALPFVILVPILVGWLRVKGESAGLYSAGFGTALRSVVEVVLLIGLLAWAARAVKKRETALRESDQRYRTLFESAPGAVFAFDRDAALQRHNSKAAELLGREPNGGKEQFGGSMKFWSPDGTLLPPARTPLVEVLRTGIPASNVELSIERSDGSQLSVLANFAPLKNAKGEITGAMMLLVDLTERRQAEAGVLHQKRLLEALTESAPDGILIVSPEGRMIHFNRHFLEIWNFPPEIIEGKSDEAAVQWAASQTKDPAEFIARVSAIYDRPGERFREEVWMRDGRVYERSGAPVLSSGTRLGWVWTFRDITERKRAELKADAASRAKDDFLAALSHELRTPLTPVLMAATTLREDLRLPADVRHQLEMMERNIVLEARLIDDLLDLTAISRGKLQLHLQPCDAHELINLALEIVRVEAAAKDIVIERTFAAQRSGLVADPARFQQVIWNLLRNAVKFTPTGGRISIITREEDKPDSAPWLRIEVSDTGVGIEPAILDRIFTPFEQGSGAGVHRFGGLGLGLAIAREVVKLHDGRITAQSEGPNQGATFVVELPGVSARGRDAGSAMRPSPAASPARAAPVRLLVVEDHESTLQTLAHMLQRDGHTVVTACDVGSALIAAEAQPFDLLISDLGLPDGTGTALMEKLRARHGLRGIALSGYGMDEDVKRSLAAGFICHFVKPVPISVIRRELANLFPRPS